MLCTEQGSLGMHAKPGWWWLGFRGSEEPEVPLGLVVEQLFLATFQPLVWEHSQPRCWAPMGEQAHAAVENLPMAKKLHILWKTVNKKHFLRQCRVALASYRHWH